ncbi:MAG: hypothetical protein WAT71_15485 [Ignavibacteria bacterium]
MKNLLLIQVLNSLSKKEFTRFEEFLKSPFYNKKPNAVKFFEAIRESSPSLTVDQIKKDVIWKHMYPKKKFNAGVFKNLVFDLTGLIEKFIEVIKYEENELGKNFILLDALSERKIHNKFFSKYDKLYKEISKSKFYQSYYSDIQKLIYKKINHSSVNTKYQEAISSEILIVSEMYLNEVIVNLSYVFNDISTLELRSNKSAATNFSKVIFGNEDTRRFITTVTKTEKKDQQILKMYYFIFLAFAYPENRENYINFKKHLYKYSGLFTQEEKSRLYISLGDALNIRPSGKNDNKVIEFLELYKKRIDENIFTESDGRVNIFSYSNIIKMAGMLSDYKLIKFVKINFFELLQEEYKENMNYYTDAYYNFSIGKFDIALQNCLKIKLEHFILKFDIKDLQAMLYYETGDYENFIYLLDTYKHFLKKNSSVSDQYKNWYGKFITNVHRLFKIKRNFDEYELMQFEKDVLDGKTGSKFWFIEKINQFKKSNQILN